MLEVASLKYFFSVSEFSARPYIPTLSSKIGGVPFIQSGKLSLKLNKKV